MPIGPMQSALIPRRTISDNILLAQDLHKFHLNPRALRMCLKLDLPKAYGSVRWKFLLATLHTMEFP